MTTNPFHGVTQPSVLITQSYLSEQPATPNLQLATCDGQPAICSEKQFTTPLI